MHSKFIAACATGALAVLLLPLAASAAGPTTVTVTVGSGTTILAPAAVDLGTGFPGQTVSQSSSVSWWSNETGTISAVLDTDLLNGANTIDAADVTVSSPTYAGPNALDTVQPVADIADVSTTTLEGPSSSAFTLSLLVPSAKAGVYTSTLTWSVVP